MRSVCFFISVGRAFHKCIPFTEYDDWPKVVLRIAALWSPFADPLVILFVPVPFTWGRSTAGARSLTHLKIYLMKENLIKLSKLSMLHFPRIMQWCHFIRLLSIVFSAYLWSDVISFIVDCEAERFQLLQSLIDWIFY